MTDDSFLKVHFHSLFPLSFLSFTPFSLSGEWGFSVVAANEEEEHGKEHEEQVDGLGAQVLFVKEDGSEEEADEHRTAPHHGDDGNHGSVQPERVEVSEVGGGEEDGNEDDAPMPTKGGGFVAVGPPKRQEHEEHEEELVEGVPRLHGKFVESHSAVLRRSHEELVVEPRYGSQHIGQHHEHNPLVVLEVDALLLAGAREHVEAYDGDAHTHPLPQVQLFGKEGQGTYEHHYGARSVDGADDGEWQVLQPKVGQQPAAEHDERLEQYVFMFCPPILVGVEKAVLADVPLCRKDDEGQEYERREQRVEGQHWYDGVVAKRFLLEDVVEAE